jgi:hypothetical protein
MSKIEIDKRYEELVDAIALKFYNTKYVNLYDESEPGCAMLVLGYLLFKTLVPKEQRAEDGE